VIPPTLGSSLLTLTICYYIFYSTNHASQETTTAAGPRGRGGCLGYLQAVPRDDAHDGVIDRVHERDIQQDYYVLEQDVPQVSSIH
jgi:hypothetical protein